MDRFHGRGSIKIPRALETCSIKQDADELACKQGP